MRGCVRDASWRSQEQPGQAMDALEASDAARSSHRQPRKRPRTPRKSHRQPRSSQEQLADSQEPPGAASQHPGRARTRQELPGLDLDSEAQGELLAKRRLCGAKGLRFRVLSFLLRSRGEGERSCRSTVVCGRSSLTSPSPLFVRALGLVRPRHPFASIARC